MGSGHDLVEDQLLVHVRAYLQLLLDKATAVLVLAKGHRVAQQVDQLPHTRLTVRAYVEV